MILGTEGFQIPSHCHFKVVLISVKFGKCVHKVCPGTPFLVLSHFPIDCFSRHRNVASFTLTLNLLMSYIYVELLVKPEILTSCIYGPTFGNAESRLFLFATQCFNTESMQKVILCHSCV
jgi:hypothetical protein